MFDIIDNSTNKFNVGTDNGTDGTDGTDMAPIVAPMER